MKNLQDIQDLANKVSSRIFSKNFVAKMGEISQLMTFKENIHSKIARLYWFMGKALKK